MCGMAGCSCIFVLIILSSALVVSGSRELDMKYLNVRNPSVRSFALCYLMERVLALLFMEPFDPCTPMRRRLCHIGQVASADAEKDC